MQKFNTLIVGILFLVNNNFAMDKAFEHIPVAYPIQRKQKTKKTLLDENGYSKQVLKVLKAIASNDLAALQSKLKKNEFFFRRYSNIGLKVLIKAVEDNKDKFLEFLLKNKANLNAIDSNRETPLFFVKNAECAQKLIEYGGLLEHKNNNGETPLFKLIKEGRVFDKENFDIVHALIKAGANINVQNVDGDTALHCAVSKKNVPIMKLLLLYGANFTVRNKQGKTSHDLAYQYKESMIGFEEYNTIISLTEDLEVDDDSYDVLSVLSDNGSSLKDFFTLNSFGYCYSGIKIMEYLLQEMFIEVWDFLESDYSPYTKFSVKLAKFIAHRSNLRSTLLDMLRDGAFACVGCLLDYNPYIMHAYKGEDELDTISMEFVKQFVKTSPDSATYDAVKKLLYRGCFNTDAVDGQGTPLLSVLIKDKQNDIKYYDVLKSGARVNAQDEDGKTALWYALLLEDNKKIERLLEYGAIVYEDMLSYENDKISAAYERQKCFKCEKRECELSSIPCVNRHIGFFICKSCDSKINSRCPLCKKDPVGKNSRTKKRRFLQNPLDPEIAIGRDTQ